MLTLNRCACCLNAETRPRITFDSRGYCNACVWAEKKRTFDWKSRKEELKKVVETLISETPDNEYHCVVPVSGGMDGS